MAERESQKITYLASMKCEICERSFANKRNFGVHVIQAHKFSARYTCDICDKVFSNVTYRKLHIITVHDNDGNFECTFCDEKFKQNINLKRHITRFHKDKEKSEHKKSELQLEDERTKNDNRNVTEFQESTDDLVKLHICKKCDTVFSEKSHLDNHMASVHRDDGNFQCSLCNRRYLTDQTLFYNAFRRLEMK